MQEILNRMSAFDCVDISVFPDDTILNVPVEEWPICDCLISFYSKGFPLEKAIEYAQLRKPFSLNDLEMQYALMDRYVCCTCDQSGEGSPGRHCICDGDWTFWQPKQNLLPEWGWWVTTLVMTSTQLSKCQSSLPTTFFLRTTLTWTIGLDVQIFLPGSNQFLYHTQLCPCFCHYITAICVL